MVENEIRTIKFNVDVHINFHSVQVNGIEDKKI
jgi:hypothetical protein